MAAKQKIDFNERAKTAADARKAALEKFRARPGPDDPAILAQAAERKAIAEAREIRAVERAKIKAAEAVQRAVDEAQRQREKAAAEAEARVQAALAAARKQQLLADQKAARDARYAARKARR